MAHQLDHPFPPMQGGGTMPGLDVLNSAAEAAGDITGAVGAVGKASKAVGTAGKVAGAAGKAASAINPLALATMGLDMGIKGFTAGKAAKDAGGSTGGAILEGVLGTVGLEGLYEDPAIKAKRKAEEVKKAGIATASNQLMKNTMEMQKEDYSNMNEDGTMATKYGVVKKLGAITGTVANNMSVAQYNSAIKMSGIAKNMDEPIKMTTAQAGMVKAL
jgi:hypothetical protein